MVDVVDKKLVDRIIAYITNLALENGINISNPLLESLNRLLERLHGQRLMTMELISLLDKPEDLATIHRLADINLKRLYEEKDNKVKLQDILAFKNINRESVHINLNDEQINIIGNNNQNYSYKLFYDPKLEIQYFYAQLPISWLKNDDEQGLQPRVIDFKRLNQLHKHFQSFPQLAPSIARLVNNDIKLFDGQHKLAAQILNNNMFIDETFARINTQKFIKLV